jgi:phosphate-selective porin OprO and OprP
MIVGRLVGFAVLLGAASPAGAQRVGDAGTPVPSAAAAPDTPSGDPATRAEAEATAARRAAQDLEAQVIELRRMLDGLGRQPAAFDDVRRRLDALESRLDERDRRQAAAPDEADGEANVVRFRDDGFYVRSPDRRFLLRPRLRLQTLYEGVLADAGTADPNDPNRSGFSLAHAEIFLEGHAGDPRFEYRLQIDVAEAQPINDAFIGWRMSPSLTLRAGQVKVPFGLQRRTWSGELELTDISSAMAAFSLERDVGLLLLGRPLAGRLQYDLAVLNGAGAGRGNENIDLAYAGRIAAAPFGPLPSWEGDLEGQARPLVSVGMAGFYNLVPTDVVARSGGNPDVDGNGRIDSVAVWQGGVEARALWRGAALQAEWFGRLEDPGVAAASRRFWGAYVQASYFILAGRLQVAGRLGRTDLPLYGATADVRASRGSELDEQTVGLNAYFRGHRAKLQVDYSHLDGRNAASVPEAHRVRALVQLGF